MGRHREWVGSERDGGRRTKKKMNDCERDVFPLPLLIKELSCKLLSSHMHETCCTNQLIPLLMGQLMTCRNNRHKV